METCDTNIFRHAKAHVDQITQRNIEGPQILHIRAHQPTCLDLHTCSPVLTHAPFSHHHYHHPKLIAGIGPNHAEKRQTSKEAHAVGCGF